MIRHRFSAYPVALGLLLLWAPMPFGSVGATFRSILWAGVVVVFVAGLWSRGLARSWGGVRAPVLLVLAVAALALVQSLWWPIGLVSVLSSEHATMARVAHAGGAAGPGGASNGVVSGDAVSEVAASEGGASDESAGPRSAPLSFSSQSSQRSALGWSMAALALLAASMLESRRERQIVLGAMVCAAIVQAVYGGPRLFGGADLIWGREMPGADGRFRGTFVNPNHAAFWFGLAIPLVTAWTWLAGSRFRSDEYNSLGVLRAGLPWIVWALLAGGLALTQSRSGAAVMVATLAVQLILLFRTNLRTALLALVAGGSVIGWLVWRGMSTGLGVRLWEAQTSAAFGGARLPVYKAALGMWWEFPLLGAGLGSFRTLFSARAPADIRGQWWNAHSDWIELLATGGLVAFGLVATSLWLVIGVLLKRARSESRESKATAVAVLGALIAATLHSSVDFALAMPANVIALAVIVGVALAPRRVTYRSRRPGTASS